MEDLIKTLFKDVLENKTYDDTLIHHYFSTSYVQIVDKQVLDFETFKKHIRRLKDKIQKLEVQVLNMVSNETTVFTKHLVTSVRRDGNIVKHKVFAEFQIENNQVVRCDELTMLMEGDKSESNLGSVI